MTLIKVLSGVFFVLSIALAAYLTYQIREKLLEEQRIDRIENAVKAKLSLIRDVEVAYQAVHGNYTASWDSLIHFLDNDTLYITSRTEEVFTKAYGVDSIVVNIDTIGTITAYDSLIINRQGIPTLIAGTVTGLEVAPGDEIKKGDIIVRMESKGKSFEVRSSNDGKIINLYVKPGDELNQQDLVALLSYKRINDIASLPYIPPKNEKRFELFADEIEKNELLVDVFMVEDTDPVDPERRDSNNPKEPLRIGSKTDVTTSGNW